MDDGRHESPLEEYRHRIVQGGRWRPLGRQTGRSQWGVSKAGNLLSDQGRAAEKFFLGAQRVTYLALWTLTSLHAVATFNNIGLQAYRTRPPVQLQEQTASVAKNGAQFIPPP